MPPRYSVPEPLSAEEHDALGLELAVQPVITEETHAQKRPTRKIVWRNVVLMSLLHLGALYGLTLIHKSHPLTWLWVIYLHIVGAMGITAGAHRLFAHRSYKARLPLRILLAIMNSVAFQNDLFEWSRDHRVHHKYSETEADPHNAKRGFFFSHIGWLLVKKHPEVIAKGKLLDVSDLLADPVVRIQRKFYKMAVLLFCFLLPTVVPNYFWGESMWNAFYLAAIMRYAVTLNITWCVNSVAHMWGSRPYDKFINPRQNRGVSFSAVGEGFHNYHHVFPQDYSTSEFRYHLNLTSMFIDFMAYLGQAYDRKKIPMEVILRRKARTGDGS